MARISNLANTKHAKIVIHRFKELSEITNLVEAFQIVKPTIDNDAFDNRAVKERILGSKYSGFHVEFKGAGGRFNSAFHLRGGGYG